MLGRPGWHGIPSRGRPGWHGIPSSEWGRILSLPGGWHGIPSSEWGRILSLPDGLHGIRSRGWTGMLSLPSLARITQAKHGTLLQAISEASTGVIKKILNKLHDLGV